MEIKSLLEVPVAKFDLILLDLDNTLYDYHSCHKFALSQLITEVMTMFSVEAEDVLALYMDGRKKIHDRNHGTAASHSRLFYIQDMVEKLQGFTDTELTLKLYRVYWDNFVSKMSLFEEATEFLNNCEEQQVPIVMVTDMTAEIQFEKIKKLKIGKYLKFVVTSEEAGVEKPHPYVFDLAIGKALRFKSNIKNIAVVGDDVKKDVHVSELYPIEIYHLAKR